MLNGKVGLGGNAAFSFFEWIFSLDRNHGVLVDADEGGVRKNACFERFVLPITSALVMHWYTLVYTDI